MSEPEVASKPGQGPILTESQVEIIQCLAMPSWWGGNHIVAGSQEVLTAM